ncbi:MAG TPA: phosphatase PAP2 family protein [Paracoccaceae bacterium]|nr:phosphatase PAP2 family protein [Paracoccaceae bacterium]
MLFREPGRAAGAVAGMTAVAALVFTLWPEVDLWFSGLFHDPAAGFWLTASPLLEFWRDSAWNLSIAMFLCAVIGLVFGLAGRHVAGVATRTWGFIATLYLIGPILLVNELLKEHWGRARPASSDAFGGTAAFSPALIPSDQCASNCSFVSGEGSAAVTLGIAMLALLPVVERRAPRAVVLAWRWAAVLIPFATLLQRIATGRHFLSDSVFATLFMLAIALVLDRLILAPARPRS